MESGESGRLVELRGETDSAEFEPWLYEDDARRRGYERIVGLDEAGRGPLAGPVVAAAVLLPREFDPAGIGDSKSIPAAARETMFDRIRAQAAFGLGVVGPEVIDEINIARATHLAMRMALDDLGVPFDFVLLDGLPVAGLPVRSLSIVRGDARCTSVGAASILAKVTRDRIMMECHEQYPDYGFASHKGYCTREHLTALDRLGPCAVHRKTFAPVAERISTCRLPGLG